MKILIVDDDPGVLGVLCDGLSGYGYEVFAAEDGYQALRILRESATHRATVDLMITDLNMPGMDGLELFRLARYVVPELSSILITTFCDDCILICDDCVKKDAIALGFCGHVEKPFTPVHLLPLINRVKGILASTR